MRSLILVICHIQLEREAVRGKERISLGIGQWQLPEKSCRRDSGFVKI